MNFKKNLFSYIVVMMIITGCASSTVATTEPEELITIPLATPTPSGPYKFSIATGPTDSAWYGLGSEMASAINREVPAVLAHVKETKNLLENSDLLTSGKAGLAIVYDYHVVLANQGRLMTAFPNAPEEKLTIKCGTELIRPMFPDYAEPARIVMPLYEEHLYILVNSEAGIASLYDLKGRHVSTGESDSAAEQQARFVLTGLGMDWDSDIVHESFDPDTAIIALKDGQLDAIFWSGAVVDGKISALLTAPDTDFALLPIGDTDAQKIMNAAPGLFHQKTIPGGSFAGIPDDVDTLAVTVVLAAMEDFSANLIHGMLTAIFSGGELPDTLSNSLPASPEAALVLLHEEARAYLHQGSLDYLSEQKIVEFLEK